ncbi:MAG: glycosyltransferase family 4 protein [Myxococcales bacterium]|nr:glycosyltransferase family 4 protein [Myxococcales bacterium]
MPSAPRVLILNERDPRNPKAGGAEIHVSEIFRRLVARGFEITLASTRFAGAPARDEVDGMRVWRLGGLPAYYPRAAWRCARETRRGRFDVVVECLNKLPFYAPMYSARPVLALCHHLFGETAFLQVPWPIAASVWAAEKGIPRLYRETPFLTISESSRDDLIERGIAPERIRVSHCGIRRPEVPPADLAARAHRVVFVGRLEPYKKVDVLLRAAARLVDRFPDIEIVVIGRGSDRPRLERIAEEVGLAERTRFVGFVDDAERDRWLATSRVCVCPSAKEGWGLTVIESNALATPVVATDAPGLRDAVRDGKTGFLVAEDDVDGFADRIGSLLAEDDLARTMAAAALEWSRGFDWDRAADEMAESLAAARLAR